MRKGPGDRWHGTDPMQPHKPGLCGPSQYLKTGSQRLHQTHVIRNWNQAHRGL